MNVKAQSDLYGSDPLSYFNESEGLMKNNNHWNKS